MSKWIDVRNPDVKRIDYRDSYWQCSSARLSLYDLLPNMDDAKASTIIGIILNEKHKKEERCNASKVYVEIT